jgi:hypothetical protein
VRSAALLVIELCHWLGCQSDVNRTARPHLALPSSARLIPAIVAAREAFVAIDT